MLKNSAKSEHQISVSSPRCTCAYEPHISRPTMSPKNWPDGDRRKSRCPQTPGAASPRFSSKDERLGPQYPSHAVTHLGKRILPNGGGSCLSDLEPTRLPERPPPPPNTHTGHLKMLQCLPGRSLHTGWEPCLERSTLSSCGDPGGLGHQKPRGRHHQMQEREMSLKHVI